MTFCSPQSELSRLAALHAYGVLDTPAEAGFEHITSLASLTEDELLLARVGKELRAEIRQRPNPPAAPHGNGVSVQELPAAADEFPQPQIGTATLPAHEGHFRQLVEQASDAVFVYDFDKRILEVNTAACEAVGYTREELLRLRVSDIDVGFDPVKGPRRWEELVPGEAMTLESLNRRKDGSVFTAEAHVSVVETGESRVLLALVRDVSHRKNAEKLLQARAQQQQAVAKFRAKALRENRVDALLNEAAAIVAGTLGLEICHVLEHVKERKELVNRAGVDLPPPERGKKALSDSQKFAPGSMLHTGEPVVIKDFRQERRFTKLTCVASTSRESSKRRASCKRMRFWNWSGLMVVTTRKYRWKELTLMRAVRASSSTRSFWTKRWRISAIARLICESWLLGRANWRSVPPHGPQSRR